MGPRGRREAGHEHFLMINHQKIKRKRDLWFMITMPWIASGSINLPKSWWLHHQTQTKSGYCRIFVHFGFLCLRWCDFRLFGSYSIFMLTRVFFDRSVPFDCTSRNHNLWSKLPCLWTQSQLTLDLPSVGRIYHLWVGLPSVGRATICG